MTVSAFQEVIAVSKRILALLLCLLLALTMIPLSVFAAQTPLVITKQPANGYAVQGEIVKTDVTAQGDDLTYQWYLKNPGQKNFHASAVKERTYSATMTAEISGRQVYCVITDCNGDSVTTDTVTLKIPTALKITQQPANGYAAEGKTVRTAVTAQGDELSYQWYLSGPGETQFSPSSVKKSAYSFTMTAKNSGRQVYCVVTDCHGNSVTSGTVTLKIPTMLKITQQPANGFAEEGKTIKTSVAAKGDALRYQWYLKNPWQDQFYESSVTGPTYSAKMTAKISGREVYCVITDDHGETVTSEIVTLELPSPIMIFRDPTNAYAFQDEIVKTTVTAEGNGLQYQWYLKNPGQDKFYESSVTGPTYSAKMTAQISGRQVYCVITDSEGNTKQTKTVTLWLNGVFHKELFKVRPERTRNLAQDLTFAAEDALVWKSSDPSIAKVDAKGVVTGVKNGTVTITVTDKANNTAQCEVKVCNLKQVALTFDDGPSSHTKRLLDFLRENDVPVTFFLVGNRINEFSSTVQQAAKDGHEIGYHSYSHKMQPQLSNAQIISDFEKSNALLYELTGVEFTLWRTPGGDYNQRVLDCIDLPHILWSVDTRDWDHRNSSKVYSSVVNSGDGDIVLMHDLYGSTVDGTISALKEMLEEDYEFLTVTELLSRDGTPPKPCTTYFDAD